MRRVCDGCGTPLKQGFVKGNRLICGRSYTERLMWVEDDEGNRTLELARVATPGCKR